MFTYTVTAYNKLGEPMVKEFTTDTWEATELSLSMSECFGYAEVINDNFQTHEGEYGERPAALGTDSITSDRPDSDPAPDCMSGVF